MALHSFTAESPDELSISPGDVISLVSRDGEWLRGKLSGKEGIFPDSFVEVRVDLPPEQPTTKAEPEKKKDGESLQNFLLMATIFSLALASPISHVVTATYDYDGEAGDLSFKVVYPAVEQILLLCCNSKQAGEKIKLVGRVDKEWVFGELNGRKGLLPVSFIDSNPDTLPPHVESRKESPPASEV